MEIDKQKQKPKEEAAADHAFLEAVGGEKLAGSGFEREEPEPGFAETETSGPAPDQDPA